MADEEENLKPTWEGDFVDGLPSGKVSRIAFGRNEIEATGEIHSLRPPQKKKNILNPFLALPGRAKRRKRPVFPTALLKTHLSDSLFLRSL